MQAVIDAIRSGSLAMQPAVVISNNRKSKAIGRAQTESIPSAVLNATTHPDPDSLDETILSTLTDHGTDLVLLAGYMKMLGPRVLHHFSGRIVNIHPSLLPKFGGQGMYGHHVHQAVLETGESETGVSIHLVNEAYDEGRILAQTPVPVMPGDTVESLAARVLIHEHRFLVETLARISTGTLSLT